MQHRKPEDHRQSGGAIQQELIMETWKHNELVLDAVFGFLPVSDLLRVRFVCKQWSQNAARSLAKKVILHVMDDDEPNDQKYVVYTGSSGHQSFVRCFNKVWDCSCERGWTKTKIRYRRVGDFQNAVWNDLRPRRLVVLGIQCLELLPRKPFELVQHLNVDKLKRAESVQILRSVATIFPKLLSLKLSEISPDNSSKRTSRNELIPVISEDPVRIFAPLSDEQTASALRLPLKSLSIEILAHFAEDDWEILKYYRRLQDLEIRSSCDFTHVPQVQRTFYAQLFEKIHTKLAALTKLTRVTLKLDITQENSTIIQTFLNQLSNLRMVSLYLKDNFAIQGQHDLIPNFFAGLSSRVISVLDKFRAPWFPVPGYLKALFAGLNSGGYFCKPKWKMTFLSLPNMEKFGWIRIKFSEDQLTLQTSHGSSWHWQELFVDFEIVAQRYLNVATRYNYAFHQLQANGDILNHMPYYPNPYSCSGFEPINDFENLNQATLFKPYFTRADWTSMYYMVCNDCRRLPRLLCDLSEFVKEAGIKLPRPRPQEEEHVRTWTFCFVEREILAKWVPLLVLEIAAVLRDLKCTCCTKMDSWDLAFRVTCKAMYEARYPNRPEYLPFMVPGRASYGESNLLRIRRLNEFGC